MLTYFEEFYERWIQSLPTNLLVSMGKHFQTSFFIELHLTNIINKTNACKGGFYSIKLSPYYCVMDNLTGYMAVQQSNSCLKCSNNILWSCFRHTNVWEKTTHHSSFLLKGNNRWLLKKHMAHLVHVFTNTVILIYI